MHATDGRDVASRTAAFDLAELPEDGDCCLLAIRNGDKSLPFFDWLTASFMTCVVGRMCAVARGERGFFL